MHPQTVVVVGGGVIGRSCALALARAGHAVTLISKDEPEATTSILAGAVWMPVYAEPLDRLNAWGAATYDWLVPLAEDPQATGVQLVDSTLWYTKDSPDWGWREAVRAESVVTPGCGGGPADVRWTARVVLPCIDMSRYLPWLRAQGVSAGVAEARRRIDSIDEAREYGDLVVLATGLETNALVPDASLYPIQGQTVRVRNPGGIGHFSYENATQTTYVIPRVDEIIIGGSHVEHAWSREIDPALEARILAQAIALVPALDGLPITSRAVGLRPGRATARLERVGDVIHAYGHGGSGVTVAWGVALEVAALV